MYRLFGFLSSALAVGATLITNDTTTIPSSFEYIIIGGGTAGLAVANRLSVKHAVLVIERGTDQRDNENINNPLIATAGFPPDICHQLGSTPPQVGSNGTKLRVQPVQFGNCLGGGSSINGMQGSRPTLAGMNALEGLGNPGWGWDEFLPFMQRSETFTLPDVQQIERGASFNASVHGFTGPVGISFPDPFLVPQVHSAAKETAESVYGATPAQDMGDGFSGGHVASFYYQIHFNETLQTQRRSSSAWSFLYPENQQRSNLTVLTEHTVNTIVTTNASDGNITATGVTLLPSSGGNMLMVSATREVIVSAGSIFSPGVLQRSGIGNSTFLQSLGISPVLDLPGVGSNFQDQVLLVNVSFPIADAFKSDPNVTVNAPTLGVISAHPTADEAFSDQGTQMISSAVRNSTSAVDQVIAAGGIVNAQSMELQANAIADAYEINHPLMELLFTVGVTLRLWTQPILPLSRGTVRINTTDPFAFPVVDPQYLTIDSDIEIFTRAARRLGLAALTPPFSDLINSTASATFGLPAVNASDDAWRMWALDHYSPASHFIGSNSMMPQKVGGVVSPELLVYGKEICSSPACFFRKQVNWAGSGTTNLRVVDASIMPLSVFPHCTLGIYGIAEQAADMILQTALVTSPM
ncbi:hypothetical protein VKT23_005978 [Stygiomarasmius scandens]|uniref:Glucose-methanol-choline oxidoreductase N-terminal domain-containing protein n=1 Tax=Marasmiellus scandens TaxID=2682957 RepID=A0ABR1JNV9_9AGAR